LWFGGVFQEVFVISVLKDLDCFVVMPDWQVFFDGILGTVFIVDKLDSMRQVFAIEMRCIRVVFSLEVAVTLQGELVGDIIDELLL